MESDYQRDGQRVHWIVYQLIWTPKWRKPVLTGSIAADSQALIEKQCTEKGWVILALAVQPDPIYLVVRDWPNTSTAVTVKECKGLTAHEVGEKNPLWKRLSSVWMRTDFAATAGNVSAEITPGYITAQQGL